MSYDVTIGKESLNYTSNLFRLWYDHMPDMGQGKRGLREIDGLTGKKAANLLARCLVNMHRTYQKDPAMAYLYDSPNGWGTTLGAILFTSELMGLCMAHPRSRVWVSS
jgi:hypothetical protein